MKKAALPPQTALFKKLRQQKPTQKSVTNILIEKVFSPKTEVPCELPDRLHFSLQYLSCQIL